MLARSSKKHYNLEVIGFFTILFLTLFSLKHSVLIGMPHSRLNYDWVTLLHIKIIFNVPTITCCVQC